jgi:hypothetical protein
VSEPRPHLAVLVDGVKMGEDEARAFWERFSAYMEEHRGDLGGFAAQEGLTSVHPEMHDGAPVLVASRKAPQRGYTNAPRVDRDRSGGQPSIHGGGRSHPKKPRKSR